MAKLLEKGGTQAKNSIGCQISKAGEVEIGNYIPQLDKFPTLITGQAGSGGPRPYVSIPVNTPHWVLSQKRQTLWASLSERHSRPREQPY